jgi:hypothetical protein
VDGMNRNAKNLAVDAQLVLSTDPIGVGGDERQLVDTVFHGKASRHLGCRGGLANTSWTHQREHTTLIGQVVSRS